MEFSQNNLKKLKLMLIAAGFVVSLLGAGKSAHATSTQEIYETCLDVELDDGIENLAEYCCFVAARGKLQCSGTSAKDCACVSNVNANFEVDQPEVGPKNYIDITNYSVGQLQQVQQPTHIIRGTFLRTLSR